MGHIYRLCKGFKYIFLIRLISLVHDLRSKTDILLLGSADGPGTVYFTGLVSHHGMFPCQIFCGMQGRHKPGGPHYYPALLKPNNYAVEGSDHPDVDVAAIRGPSAVDYTQKLCFLLQARNVTDYEDRHRETGISKPSIISGLPTTHRLPITSTLASV